MNYHLFGALTPAGEAFRRDVAVNSNDWPVLAYSRSDPSLLSADFLDPASFQPGGEPGEAGVWISFAPIWLFAPFLEQLATHYPDRLESLRAVIACSSSSSITKRFAVNRFDRHLVDSLTAAEDQLLSICKQLSISCRILRPTMIYGQAGGLRDRNLSLLLQLMRCLPLLPMPAESGLRQPIHACQLAAVALHLVKSLSLSGRASALQEVIAIGGDTTLTYAEMICALKLAQPTSDPARSCCVFTIPNRLFYLLFAPLLLFSPKRFEAVLRIGANLSGFTSSHVILGSDPKPFPVLPL